MRFNQAVATAMRRIFPWPTHHQRAVEVREAQERLAHQRERLAQAQKTQVEIEAIKELSGNHFAQRIANQIARGYQHPPRPRKE